MAEQLDIIEKKLPRILIVEDSATQALRLQHFLEQHGLEADCADSAESALEQLNSRIPDLLVTDLNLPGVSGIELCRRLRISMNTRGIPILLLTGDSDTALESEALESGADDYVRKSEDPDMLLLRIQTLLRKSRFNEVLASAEARFSSAKVLVVEDNATYRQMLVGELESEAYQVKTAETGEQALAHLAMESFDVIVLDLVLPDTSGLDVCRRIAKSHRTVDNDFMILALSGEENRDEMSALLEAGADDVLDKSRVIDVIKARLRAMIRRKLLYEENRRIQQDFRASETALLEERAERKMAEARAALVDQLEDANRELKQTQSQLVQSAKMASLGQLVAGIAHEINNPIAYVGAHLKTVRRLCDEICTEIAQTLPKEAAGKLAKMQQRVKESGEGVDRVAELVLKLRTFSRLDEGERKEASVRENVDSVLAMLTHRMKGRVRVECRLGEPDRIDCYPALLNQALMNIVSNAIDAIEGEGGIEITSGLADGGYEIAVRDSGQGIPKALQERVFEPFFTTKPVGSGTGLGMSITYQIVTKHGGTIRVDSEEGQGTRIAIVLPLSAAGPPGTQSNTRERETMKANNDSGA